MWQHSLDVSHVRGRVAASVMQRQPLSPEWPPVLVLLQALPAAGECQLHSNWRLLPGGIPLQVGNRTSCWALKKIPQAAACQMMLCAAGSMHPQPSPAASSQPVAPSPSAMQVVTFINLLPPSPAQLHAGLVLGVLLRARPGPGSPQVLSRTDSHETQSLAAFPRSFKLAWSPVVDSVYSLALGRRKSWVVPIQLASAGALLLSADWADAKLQVGFMVGASHHVVMLCVVACWDPMQASGAAPIQPASVGVLSLPAGAANTDLQAWGLPPPNVGRGRSCALPRSPSTQDFAVAVRLPQGWRHAGHRSSPHAPWLVWCCHWVPDGADSHRPHHVLTLLYPEAVTESVEARHHVAGRQPAPNTVSITGCRLASEAPGT